MPFARIVNNCSFLKESVKNIDNGYYQPHNENCRYSL